MALNRNQILAASDVQIERVSVPEWGGDVCIRVLSGSQRDKLDAFVTRNMTKEGTLKDPSGLRVLICTLACCDEAGKPLFKADDAAELAEKSSAVLDRIVKAASALNGLGDAAIEVARENLAGDQSEGSG